MKTYSIPRHIWRALYPPLIYVAISLLAGFTTVFIYILYIGFREGFNGLSPDAINSLINADIPNLLMDKVLWITLGGCLVGLAVFIPMYRAVRKTHTFFEGGRLTSDAVPFIIAGSMALSIFIGSFLEAADLVKYFPSYDEIIAAIENSGLFAQILVVCIAGPMAEEYIFRGVVQNRLAAWLPVWAAVAGNSLLFGIIHLNLLQGIYAFPIGILLSLIYIRYKTLWAPIIAHIAFNSAGILINFILESAGINEVSVWALLIPSLVISAACLWVLIKKPGRKPLPGGGHPPDA